jgi:hypothetical protein
MPSPSRAACLCPHPLSVDHRRLHRTGGRSIVLARSRTFLGRVANTAKAGSGSWRGSGRQRKVLENWSHPSNTRSVGDVDIPDRIECPRNYSPATVAAGREFLLRRPSCAKGLLPFRPGALYLMPKDNAAGSFDSRWELTGKLEPTMVQFLRQRFNALPPPIYGGVEFPTRPHLDDFFRTESELVTAGAKGTSYIGLLYIVPLRATGACYEKNDRL